MTVRAACAHDLEQLCRVRDTLPLYLQYLEECDGTNACFLVAELDGLIAGFGLVYMGVTKSGKRKSHLPKLSDLHVGEHYRRHGVGTALVLAREELARQAGYDKIYVSIDPVESAEMIALAKKLSYEPLQEVPYPVEATFFDARGQSYAKRYFRLDFSKRLG